MSKSSYYEVGVFPVFFDEKSAKWCVQTAVCTLEGCDICEKFENQEKAHSHATQLAATKHELDRCLCDACYQEYVQYCW
ncbi:hypothetical protein [Alicyclobacillus mengziensis]|uniref:Uncharacterized protein n=1 Tax=Alicyclobacillus mengziensis TaxID=2931921 RepID=A0A9X7W420_9BACL|nr:hypothetical protein [Alicyclobacillus mengziensis]QSO50122.1 hypothetical protein JZ786_24715 [Alicyclobacillus mengziensis]